MSLLDVMTSPWAIVPTKLVEIQEIYLRHVRGERLDPEQLAATIGRAGPPRRLEQRPDHQGPGYDLVNGVAVLPIEGVLGKKMNLLHAISGGASTELIGQALRQALDDPGVRAILLKIDSPGGAVDGTAELARTIYRLRGQKPIVGYTDGCMASAAYWIGSAADRLVISGDTVEVGSIGVIASHVDLSKWEEMRGIKTTEIVAGKYKRIASAYAPLTTEGRASLQDQVDYVYSAFVEAVATHRGVPAARVVADMADGRVFIGRQGITAGLVDEERDVHDLLRDMGAGTYRKEGRMGGSSGTQTTVSAEQEVDARVREAREPARREGFEAGHAEGLALGAQQERARIQAVEAQALPGHESLIQTLKYDGTTSGPEAAARVVEAERTMRETRLSALYREAPAPVPPAEPPPPGQAQASAEQAIKDIQQRDSCDYRTAAVTAAKERPELFTHRH